MERLIAIALFIATLFFAACGILSQQTSDLYWIFDLGAVGSILLGIFLWQRPSEGNTGRTTPVEKGICPKESHESSTPLDKTGTARSEEALDMERNKG